jgi:hypothetical protein
MWVITLGECAYTRLFPSPQLQKHGPPVPHPDSIQVDIGLSLSPGHHSFMDGFEGREFIIPNEEMALVLQNNRRCLRIRTTSRFSSLTDKTFLSLSYYDALGGEEQRHIAPDTWDMKTLLSLTEATAEASANLRRILNRRTSFLGGKPHEQAVEKEDKETQKADLPNSSEAEEQERLFGTHVNSLVSLPHAVLSLLC